MNAHIIHVNATCVCQELHRTPYRVSVAYDHWSVVLAVYNGASVESQQLTRTDKKSNNDTVFLRRTMSDINLYFFTSHHRQLVKLN